MDFKVYNRWGTLVYNTFKHHEDAAFINWDGYSNEAKPLATGIYYYHATVIFDVLDPDLDLRKIKGWLQILR